MARLAAMLHARRPLALLTILVGAAVLAACFEDDEKTNAFAGAAVSEGTTRLRGVATPGNCGGSASLGEDSCKGRADGIYCSTLRDFGAIECKDQQIVAGHQCNLGEMCISDDGAPSLQCGTADELDEGQGFRSGKFRAAADELNKYGEECQAEVGLMPEFDCLDFPEIPTTQDGKPLTVVDKGGGALEIQRDGKVIPGTFGDIEVDNPDGSKATIPAQWDPPPKCDNPSWASTPCYPGTRVGLLKSGGAAWAILCRRQSVQKSDDPYFQLIGVIAHNKTTGATCFFDKKPEVTLTKKNFVAPGVADAKKQREAARIWAEPGESFENCMQCHATGAFIRSPYVSSVALRREMGRSYNIIGKKFKELWMRDAKDGAPEDAPRELVLDDGSCQGCHRLASSTQARMFANLAVGGPELDYKSSDTRLAVVAGTATRWPAGFFMPPDGRDLTSLKEWMDTYGTDQKTVSDCANDPTTKGCTLQPYAFFK